jgi:formylglycine-generating enzyme required for sulfatase activity
MSRERRHANEVVEALRNAEPARYELARYVSIAARIDQPFLRSVRLALVPQASTRDELELWFSPLVERFNVAGFIFFPEVANVLRDSLRGEPERVLRTHRLLALAHRHLAPVVQLEERLTAEALAGRPLGELEQTLAPAMRAMLNPQRGALARWAQRALPRLPPEVQSLPVAEVCQQRAELLSALPDANLDRRVSDWRQLVQLQERTVALWICHTGNSLQLGMQQDGRQHVQVVNVRHAVPQLVKVSGRAGSRLLRLAENSTLSVPVDAGPLRLSFADGQVFRVSPADSRERGPGQQRIVFVSYDQRDAEYAELLAKLLGERLQGQFVLQLAGGELGAGSSIEQEIESRLRQADVVLVLLGDSWLEPRGKILHDAAKFMPREIEAALAWDIPIVPVKIGESFQAGNWQLPESLAALANYRIVDLGPGLEQIEPIRRLGREIRDVANRGRHSNSLAPFRAFRDRLPDGSLGPEMVVLPAGTFWMGSDPLLDETADEDEQPRHRVTLAEPFAIGRYPVTFDEYDRFAQATGREEPHAEGWGRERRPVINVDWAAARDYAQWLSECSGRDYRLPSEAQWEYAARAGSTTAWFWGGAEAGADTHAWYSGNSKDRTWPVGGKRGNSWGLHDMAGNVWEWVEDVWHPDYRGAPGDGDAWVETNSNDAARRVLRGGSWFNSPESLRSAIRIFDGPDFRNSVIGFRVVCRPH